MLLSMLRIVRVLCLAMALTGVARAEPIPVPADLPYASAVWGDGQDLLYIAKADKDATLLYECRRGAAPRRIEPADLGLTKGVRMTGSGTGPGVQLVLWDRDGHAAWFRGGQWQLTQLPLQPGDQEIGCMGVLPDDGQTFSCVTHSGAVMQWQAAMVRRVEPPRSELAILSVTAAPAGVIYMMDAKLQLLRFQSGSFEFVALPKLIRTKEDATDSRPGVWWNQRDAELWVGFSARLLVVDVRRGRTHVRDVPDELLSDTYAISWTAIRGGQGRGGPFVWASSYKHKLLCDHVACYGIPVEDYLYDGFLSPGDGIFYAATDKGFAAVPIAAAALGNGPGHPYVRKLHRAYIPFLNLGMGPRWPLPEGDVAFALDLMLGLRKGWVGRDTPVSTGFWLVPQVGYSYTPGTQLFVGGLGLGYGSTLAAVDYTPRLIVGGGPDGTVWGVRHGISGHFLYDMLAVEVAHQYTGAHDVRLMFAFNPGVLVVGGLGMLVVGGLARLPKLLGRLFWR